MKLEIKEGGLAMAYRTKLGWQRAFPQKTSQFAKDVLAGLTPLQKASCWHWQCGCGCFDMVEFKGRVYCQCCGKLRYGNAINGTVYYTKDDVVNCQYCNQ